MTSCIGEAMSFFVTAWSALGTHCSIAAQLKLDPTTRAARLGPFLQAAEQAASDATPEDVDKVRPMASVNAWSHQTFWVADYCAPVIFKLWRSGTLWNEPSAEHFLLIMVSKAPKALSPLLGDPSTLRRLFASSVPGKLEGSQALNHLAHQIAQRPQDGLAQAFEAAREQFLQALTPAGLGPSWVMACVRAGSLDKASQALEAGVDLSGQGQPFSQMLFRALCRASLDPLARLLANDQAAGKKTDKTQRREAIAQTGAAKARFWTAARAAGLEPIGGSPDVEDGREKEFDPYRMLECPTAAWVLKAEALLGGGLNGPAASLWLRFSKSPSWLNLEDQLWDGADGARWALSRGMDPSFWTSSRLTWIENAHPASAGAMLVALADAGLRLDPAAQFLDDLLGLAFQAGCPTSSIGALIRMGADPRRADAQGRWPLQRLCVEVEPALKRASAQALLEAAKALDPAAPATLLGARSDDGAGPMHWAAASGNAELVEFMASMGADIEAVDDKKRTPAHALARASSQLKGKSNDAIWALERLGANWGALDAKGCSALAMLASKNWLEPMMELAKARPENAAALSAKSGSAMDAGAIARRIGGASWAAFERGLMDLEIHAHGGARAKSPPKGARL
jgi:hypothetical protein